MSSSKYFLGFEFVYSLRLCYCLEHEAILVLLEQV